MKNGGIILGTLLAASLSVQAQSIDLNANQQARQNQEIVALGGETIMPWAWANVKEAIDGIARREQLTVSYAALNSVQMEWLTTRNVVLEAQRPLHWKVLLNEVLRGLKFGFVQNDAGVVEIMPFDIYHAYRTGEAQRQLQNNHKTVDVTFQRMALMDALTDVTRQAGISLNAGYLPLEIRDPAAAQAAAEAVQANAKKEEQSPAALKVYETSFRTITPMEWRNVLKNVLDPHGYDFVEMDGAVCPMEKNRAQQMRDAQLAAKPIIRQVVPIFYADPTDLMARIQELGVLSSRGKITLTQSTGKNTINDGGGAAKLRPRVREDLVVSDVAEHVLQATEWIRKLDVSDGQVMIEARILSIADMDSKKRGVNWKGYQEEFLKLGLNATTTSWLLGNTIQNWNPQKTPVAANAVQATLDTKQLTAALSFMNEMDNIEQLSHPLIVLGNRTDGKIKIKNQTPFWTKEVTATVVNDTVIPETTYSFEEQETGLELWICPEISPDEKKVRMSVYQKLSDFTGKVVTTPDGSTKEETTESDLDTRAMVRDGDTLVIGGLVTTKNTVFDRKVPFLGDIPLLGRLFRYEDKIVTKENLVIMITPTILDADTPATGYEPKSKAKADELAAKGTDYFYKNEESKGESLNVEGEKPESSGQESGVGGQESGVGGQESESEVRSQDF